MHNKGYTIYYSKRSITDPRLSLALGPFLRHENDTSLENKEQREQLSSFLDLSKLIACVEPVDGSVHLELADIQIDALKTSRDK